jgi:hypothetical protein
VTFNVNAKHQTGIFQKKIPTNRILVVGKVRKWGNVFFPSSLPGGINIGAINIGALGGLERTLLNAVLVGLAVGIDGGSDSLDALIEVVLGGRASSRLLALCESFR